ncbi:MAG: glycosyltransferase [Ferruginibacter sp.]
MEQGNLNDMPLVSIAMATYNGYAFLRQQLDSILTQTITDFEIIIVDDLSVDDTRSILKEYGQTDKRIKLYFNDKNVGYREAFYMALEHCSSNHILFCDQDDIWLPHKLETLLNTIGEDLLIFSDSALVDDTGNQINVKLSDTVKMVQPGEAPINRGFVIGNCVWGHTIMFHRNLLAYTSGEKNMHPHDWWFAVVSSHLNRIKFCPAVLNYYRQHQKNVTQAIPVKTGKVAGRKSAEFELQLSRMSSIANLDFNNDNNFYHRWQQLFLKRRTGFSFSLFAFLLSNRKDIFSLKRKNLPAQIVEIRKMCRKVS